MGGYKGGVTTWPPESVHGFDGWAAVFTDAVGSTEALISNDGARVHLRVLGVRFAGAWLDDFAPVGNEPVPGRLRLHRGDLCDYRLEFRVPMTVREGADDVATALDVCVELGPPTERGGLSHEWVQLRLSFDGAEEYTTRRHDLFETALDEVREHLGAGSLLKCCFGCDFSDYSPYGNGMFGTLYCFRTAKEQYRRVVGKDEIFELWDEAAGAVQETWLCEEWEARAANRGYRG